jgi:putative transposase
LNGSALNSLDAAKRTMPETPSQGEASERSPAGHTIERDLGDGLRTRSARHRAQTARAYDRRYLLALLTGGGAAVQLPGADVVEILEEVGREVGFSVMIRVDQGTEFVSRDLDLRAYSSGLLAESGKFPSSRECVAGLEGLERPNRRL